MSQKSIALPSLPSLFSAWEAAQVANPGVTLEIMGDDTGGWYLAWDHPEWDRAYPLDASRASEHDGDAWFVLAHNVFCPPDPTGTPVTYPHRATLARAGHRSSMGAEDDGRGYDAGDRTYTWQTFDRLVSALALAVPPEALREIVTRWLDAHASMMQWALEQALPPTVTP